MIYSLEWRDLERILALVFEEIGYKVKLTQASNDGGKDIILYCVSNGNNKGKTQSNYYVEIKHWQQETKVSKGIVNKLLEVSIRDEATGSIFLSTSGFSTNVLDEFRREEALSLGNLSTIHTLCKFYLASRSNAVLTSKSLEEITKLE